MNEYGAAEAINKSVLANRLMSMGDSENRVEIFLIGIKKRN